MKYRKLGSSGCQVSAISLGSWLTYGSAVDQAKSDACVRAAWDHGINLFDTADVYNRGEAEIALAHALRRYRRQDYVLATKAFWPMSDNVNDRGLSRKHLFESCHASLKRLQTDYIDLYQCHRYDPDTALDEVVRAMEDLIRAGKVLYWGTSVWTAGQIAEACKRADHWLGYRPVTNQPLYNLLDRSIEQDILPTCIERGIGQIVFCPLAQGLLTGKYSGGAVPRDSRAADDKHGSFLRPRLTEENIVLVDRIARVARDMGITPAQLALAFVLRREGVASAIIGATRAEQIAENVKAVDIDVPAEVLHDLEQWTRPDRAVG